MARKKQSAKRGSSNDSGFPSWGLYAIGGLAIAGIIYGLSKYGPTSETLSGWMDSATGFMGGEDDAEDFATGDFDEDEDEGTTNATSGSGSSSFGSVQ